MGDHSAKIRPIWTWNNYGMSAFFDIDIAQLSKDIASADGVNVIWNRFYSW